MSRIHIPRVPPLALIVAVYLALVLPTIGRPGIGWDEQTDLTIARSFFAGPDALLKGSSLDVINVRLPMFAVAGLQHLGAPLDLRTARLASCAVGVLTLLGVFVAGRVIFDRRRGLLAAVLLAVNPYFLAYSRLGLTQGDVFVACSVAWVLAAFAWLWKKPSRGRALAAGLALGLAFSSKFSALTLIPAVMYGGWLFARPRLSVAFAREAAPWLALFFVFGAWLLLQAVSTNAPLPILEPWIPESLRSPHLRLAAIFALLSCVAIWSLARPGEAIGSATTHLQPLLVAGFSFFVFPPSHTTNDAIFVSLLRATFGAGRGFDPSMTAEAVALHLSVIWVKPSLGIGTAFLVGIVMAFLHCRKRRELRWPLAALGVYGGGLLLLPWAQVHYAMALLPGLAILAADALLHLSADRPRRAASMAVAIGLLCAFDLALCYPDPNLNGHQWFGTRYWAGRSTLGYRSIGQIGSDGLEQCTRWVDARARPGETVVTYSLARHIVKATRSDPPQSRWIDGIDDQDALQEAVWVITQINDDIRDGYGPDDPTGQVFQYPRYDRSMLLANFYRVYSVTRRFGIEVAAVWRRR